MTNARSSLTTSSTDFVAELPNQKWLADFTYSWTAEGWLYVAVVLDLFSRRVVGPLSVIALQSPAGQRDQ